MAEHALLGLASVIILGIGAEWLAWRFRLPSILLLLVFGFLAGPATGFLDPDALLGDLLSPIVSISVAVILFEGGLSLKLSELRVVGSAVRNLISLGALITWTVCAGAAHFVLHLDARLALLFGAIMIVTGPTVIIPLLRHVRPTGEAGPILKWEGIVIDPIGAMVAVLVFEAIVVGDPQHVTQTALIGILKTVMIGGILGFLAAFVMMFSLKRFWIPDFLHNAVSLMMVVVIFLVSNRFQSDSGLLAVTLMGIALANQKQVEVKHILEFKENLRVLLISGLFILLAARLKVSDIDKIGFESIVFLGVLILIARPLAVIASTLGTRLSWRERIFLCWMAPRGIVAAAVASVFALRLTAIGYAQAEQLVPLTFFVIVCTVAIYGLTASPVAHWLGVAQANPQGLLILGAHHWVRDIAAMLHAEGYPVLLVDTHRPDIYKARMEGLPTFHAGILSQHFLDEVELSGIGRMLALTSNDEVNSLAAIQFADLLGRPNVYQLIAEGEEEGHRSTIAHHLHGRHLFGPGMTYEAIENLFAGGSRVKKNRITEEFDYKSFRALYGEEAVPLFVIEKNGDLTVVTEGSALELKPGQTLISLVREPETRSTKAATKIDTHRKGAEDAEQY